MDGQSYDPCLPASRRKQDVKCDGHPVFINVGWGEFEIAFDRRTKRIEGIWPTKLNGTFPCKTSALAGLSINNHWRTPTSVSNDMNVNRRSLNQSTTCSLGQCQREIDCFWVVCRDVFGGVAAQNIVSAGRTFMTGRNSRYIDRHGYKPVVNGASSAVGHGAVQNDRLKWVPRKHSGRYNSQGSCLPCGVVDVIAWEDGCTVLGGFGERIVEEIGL